MYANDEMLKALAQRRGKFLPPMHEDATHKANEGKEGAAPISGHSTEGGQDDYERQVNMGEGNEAPVGATPNAGGDALAQKEMQEAKEAEMLTHMLGSSNAPGLRGRVVAEARGKFEKKEPGKKSY